MWRLPFFNELKKYTPYVQEQNTPFTTYDGKNHQLRNIIAEFSQKRITEFYCVHIGIQAMLLTMTLKELMNLY